MEEQKITEEKDPKTVRFSDAAWFKPGLDVIIGGVGSIGSHLSYFLARQGCVLHLFDMDVVEEVNLGGQLHNIENAGNKKTFSIRTFLDTYAKDTKIFDYDRYEESSIYSKYMFSCFDNMQARKTMFENWKKSNKPDKIFIDGRMGAESAQLFLVTPDRIEQYEKELFDDSVIPDAPCTYKSTTHCGSLLASLMVAGFNNHFANQVSRVAYRSVPFKTEINLQLFQFNTV